MSIEIGINPKIQSKTPKDVRENAVHQRRRNILHLILDYLKEEGLFQTADSLITEAHMNNEYQLCDNIDLSIILQEYSNYYYLKFSKYPNICKKNDDNKEPLGLCTAAKTGKSRNNKKNPKNNNQKPNISKDEEESKSVENPFIVTKLHHKGDGNNMYNYCNNNEDSILERKPFAGFLANVSLDFKSMAEVIYQETFYRPTDVKMFDIKGLENAKTSLREAVIYPLKYPKLFSGFMSPWKGILLYGPPGSGKTLLVEALANECKRTFFSISSSTILSKWRGESEKNVKILFNLARYYSPSIIFIDEVESLASNRDCPTEHEASRRLKSEILIELDGLGRCSDDILFLVTSNLPWEIDPALLRRLEKRIHIPLPSSETREEMFKTFLEKSKFDVSAVKFGNIVERTEGYSGSDIRIVCKEAAMVCVRNIIMASNADNSNISEGTIHQKDIETSILKIKPSAKDLSKKYIKWSQTMGAE